MKKRSNKINKKRIIIITVTLILLVALIVPICFCAKNCIRSDSKYDYDMSKYISLPSGYKGFAVTVELDSVQAAIDQYIMQYAKEYTVKKGDDVFVDINVYEVVYIETSTGSLADKKGDEILELKKDNYLLENVGAGNYAQNVEASFIGKTVKAPGGVESTHNTASLKIKLPMTFYAEEWRGKEVFIDMTFVSKASKLGDVVAVSYTGYLLDQKTLERLPNPDKEKETDNDYKVFDSSQNAQFYLGSHLAIDGFEENIAGMKIGETKTFKAAFPDDYSNEEVKGQAVEFVVTLSKIFVPPVYDNTFTKTYLDHETTKELEESLKRDYIMTCVYEHLIKNCVIHEYPKAEYKQALKDLEDIQDDWESEYGITLDKYLLQTFNMTRDEYVKNNMKSEMVYYAVARENGIEPSSAKLAEEKESLITYYKEYFMSSDNLDANTAKSQATSYVENLGSQYIYESVLFNMVDEWLVDNATVTYNPIPEGMESITIQIAKDNAPVTE